MTLLKSCPFCGGAATSRREHLDERVSYADYVTVRCTGCGVEVGAMGDRSKPGYADNSTVQERAEAKWNRRA